MRAFKEGFDETGTILDALNKTLNTSHILFDYNNRTIIRTIFEYSSFHKEDADIVKYIEHLYPEYLI